MRLTDLPLLVYTQEVILIVMERISTWVPLHCMILFEAMPQFERNVSHEPTPGLFCDVVAYVITSSAMQYHVS
jgi:hypothetical protein